MEQELPAWCSHDVTQHSTRLWGKLRGGLRGWLRIPSLYTQYTRCHYHGFPKPNIVDYTTRNTAANNQL